MLTCTLDALCGGSHVHLPSAIADSNGCRPAERNRSQVGICLTSTYLLLPYAPSGAYNRKPIRPGGNMSPTRAKAPQPEAFLRYPGSALVISLLADKWTIPVIHALARGTKRTGELKRTLGGVSQKMLTQTLRALED